MCVGKEVKYVCGGGEGVIVCMTILCNLMMEIHETALYLSPTLAEDVQPMEAGRATVNLEGTPTNIKWWNRGCGQIFRLFGKVSAILVSITMTIMYDNHTTVQEEASWCGWRC